MAWTAPTGDKCVIKVADVTCYRKGVLSIQEVQLPARDQETLSACMLSVANFQNVSAQPPAYLMEYTSHSKKFCMEDESECFGKVVSSDADEFDVEQLDPSGCGKGSARWYAKLWATYVKDTWVHGRDCRIADGDVNSAIVYLEGKASVDHMAMARYNLTKEGMLSNLFWADGMSRVDYQHFGDVLAFDSTYKKNKYRRLLVILSGANNHKQTTIFGFRIVLDETITSYKWMLENLLEVMCNKFPSVVVIDGDDAIIAAVTENVTSNGNEQMFRDLFSRWLYADMSIDDFEAEWAEAADEYELHDKLWAMQIYEKRKIWANAYLGDKFYAGFRTTSRCEGINSHVKKFLSSKHTILELVQNLELVLREYRNNEMVAQFNSIYNVPVMTTCLDPIEKCAAMVYTRTIFTNVKKEIDAVRALNFVSKQRVSMTVVYTMEEYSNPGKPVVTLIDINTTKLECRCNFCAREGIPCRHMFFVMKHEHLKTIPHRLILKRWRKDAKAVEDYSEKKDVADDRGFLLRHGALHAVAQWLLFLGAQSHELFNVAMRGIRSMCVDMEGLHGDGYDQTNTDPEVGVRDPAIVRMKGAPSTWGISGKKRRCTTCRRTGHTKRRCAEGFKKASVKLHDLEEDADVIPHKEKSPKLNQVAKGRTAEVDGEEGIAADCEFDCVIGTAQSETVKAKACKPEGNWATEVLDLIGSLHAHVEHK
ncbi:protein FAR1-RELATED SEQUENCE 9-like [Arachis duranensis]|uniref:Protein FAR1-RELATED SEQUENCE 9-like n=1 Tax=Arachis duranensis TaxID=130453 RepID=A0A9C6TJ61_ARADU|nr:protein FAR1-RELATED SEQUENCE 9-like [Arachis duranensis]